MQFKRSFTDPVPSSREAAFDKAGIATFHGRARFRAPGRLTINDNVLETKHVVIATGARPRPLGIPGEEHVTTSTEFLELEGLPSRVTFIGAGYISFEFAHVARRAGARVTMPGRGTPLARFDQDLVARLVKHTCSIGVDLRTETEVSAVDRTDDAFTVHVKGASGPATMESDLVVHGAGRVPDTDGLGLRQGNIATDEHRRFA